ncbi:3-hydroxyacyl-ACP dehydratase [Aquimarina rhabdastrellae]
MLITDFYQKQSEKIEGNIQTTVIKLNPENDVFKGHFPNKPITPGVCMLQIIKELTEERLQTSLLMTKASNVKFMAVINPEETPILTIKNEFTDKEDSIKVKNVCSYGDTVALKVVTTFKKI